MPAQSSIGGLNLLFPQQAADAQAILYKRQLAQQLMQQSMEPIQSNNAPISPYQGLAKMAQALVGGMGMNQANQDSTALATSQGQALAQMLGGMPATQPTAQPQAQPWTNPDTGEVAPQSAMQPMQGGSSGGFGPNGLPANQRLLAYALDPNAYAASTLKQYEPTDQMKNDAATHITPEQRREMIIAENAKNSILPDQTVNGMEHVPVYATDIMHLNQPQQPISPQNDATLPAPSSGGTPVSQALPAELPSSGGQFPGPQGGPVPIGQPQPPVFGINPAIKAKATAEATKLGETAGDSEKTLNVMTANLPVVLQRFQKMSDAAKNASSGYGVDNEGEGWKQKLHNALPNDQTSVANTVLRQAASQGILPELGPQLAQAGIRGNKFLETLASSASGLNLDDSPQAKQAAISGLQNQYIQNLKSTARQVRAQGGQAPSEADIDAAVAKISPQRAATPQQSAPVTKTIGGNNYVQIGGHWYQQ